MDTVHDTRTEFLGEDRAAYVVGLQSCAYLLELSQDWIVLRASENIHRLLGESHVTLIDEPLGRFVKAEALHDLRNLFSRLSGTTGIARAYRIRLTEDPDLVDIAFQLVDGRVVLEAISSSDKGFGQAFGTIGGLIAGLDGSEGQALLDGGARRMRALTGYDRVTLTIGGKRAQSSRGALVMDHAESADGPTLVCDVGSPAVPIFPRKDEDSGVHAALLRALTDEEKSLLQSAGVGAVMRVAFTLDGEVGEFRCENHAPREPNLEVHAAAELFAQLFAARLQIDRLKKG